MLHTTTGERDRRQVLTRSYLSYPPAKRIPDSNKKVADGKLYKSSRERNPTFINGLRDNGGQERDAHDFIPKQFDDRRL